MALPGYATSESTRRYRERVLQAGLAHAEHFRDGFDGLSLSSIGLGTYLGGHDAGTDSLYLSAIHQALTSECNVLDSAVNDRCQRSERVVGQALAAAVGDGTVAQDEVFVATKGGFIPYDGIPPPSLRLPPANLRDARHHQDG
jgi:aryl-alcohol dehydrogenase-like predicted oxidoreductase